MLVVVVVVIVIVIVVAVISVLTVSHCVDYLPCHQNATCKNIMGSDICVCLEGYTGDGIEECTLGIVYFYYFTFQCLFTIRNWLYPVFSPERASNEPTYSHRLSALNKSTCEPWTHMISLQRTWPVQRYSLVPPKGNYIE